jgi:hypothetical protein
MTIILETAVGRAKAVHVIDVHGGFKKFVVTYMEVGNAENAGAIFGHLYGDENFLPMLKAFVSGASITCADLRDPTAVSRFKYASKKKSWYFRPDDWNSSSCGAYSMDDIRDKYGSAKPSKPSREALQL